MAMSELVNGIIHSDHSDPFDQSQHPDQSDHSYESDESDEFNHSDQSHLSRHSHDSHHSRQSGQSRHSVHSATSSSAPTAITNREAREPIDYGPRQSERRVKPQVPDKPRACWHPKWIYRCSHIDFICERDRNGVKQPICDENVPNHREHSCEYWYVINETECDECRQRLGLYCASGQMQRFSELLSLNHTAYDDLMKSDWWDDEFEYYEQVMDPAPMAFLCPYDKAVSDEIQEEGPEEYIEIMSLYRANPGGHGTYVGSYGYGGRRQ